VFIPNGADRQTVRKQDQLRTFGLTKDKYLLTVGRLMPVKGIHHLIQAFRRTKTQKQLVIVGAQIEGDRYTAQLHALAKGDPRIHFLGFQTGETLAQLYAHAYLYCQPSESEGLPLTVLEAMSFGTAVLVSDIPGNLEAIHRSGFTFMNKDVDDLTAQLQHVLNHPDEVVRVVRDVKRVVAEYFAWDRIVERTLEVYRSSRH
jgi:glycosyltransferase involved in cell wall biosynthesis